MTRFHIHSAYFLPLSPLTLPPDTLTSFTLPPATLTSLTSLTLPFTLTLPPSGLHLGPRRTGLRDCSSRSLCARDSPLEASPRA
ncbi:hypothetical protein E2C01_091718 [Portunus trituberculatus]|uniref:Uncharacterized protein n=1 Tax=Portunus trituberculatus TaxID=210409 RepID=A0A5B7JNP9_PORTR|nr:hypothetical protein [Portunus trituberculatus]